MPVRPGRPGGLWGGLILVAASLAACVATDGPVFLFRGGKERANFAYEWCPVGKPCFSYADFPELFASPAERDRYLEEVDKFQEGLGGRLADVERAGGNLYILTYQPALPPWAMASVIKSRPEAVCGGGQEKYRGRYRTLCPSSPFTRAVVESQFDEIFRKFPSLAGVLLTFGDGGADITGRCDRCRDYPVTQRVVDYTLLVRKTIQAVNPRAKIMIRSWSIPGEVFRDLPALLPDDVYFMFKLSSPPCVDYAWGDRYSPFLGMERSVIEGSNTYHTDSRRFVSHLCYTGPRQKARALLLLEKGVLGVWGGGVTVEPDILDDFNVDAESEISWDPYRFDPDRFIERWCRRRFGDETIGMLVAAALKETWKITNSFIIDDLQPGTFHMSRFDPEAKGGYETAVVQPEAIRGVDEAGLPGLLARYEIREALAVAESSDRRMSEALALAPGNADLRRLSMMAAATLHLARLFKEYHLALIYHNLSRNVGGGNPRADGYRALATEHITTAVDEMEAYHTIFSMLHPDLTSVRDWKALAWPLRHYCVYLTFTREETLEGYTRIVMERRAERYPVTTWRYDAGGGTLPMAQEVEAGTSGAIHPANHPSWMLKFNADLSRGGMIRFVMAPLGDREILGDNNPGGGERMDHTWNRMKFKVLLDGKPVGEFHEMAHRLCRYGPTRYLELPPTPGEEHTLTLTASDGTGVLFRRIDLQTNDE